MNPDVLIDSTSCRWKIRKSPTVGSATIADAAGGEDGIARLDRRKNRTGVVAHFCISGLDIGEGPFQGEHRSGAVDRAGWDGSRCDNVTCPGRWGMTEFELAGRFVAGFLELFRMNPY